MQSPNVRLASIKRTLKKMEEDSISLGLDQYGWHDEGEFTIDALADKIIEALDAQMAKNKNLPVKYDSLWFYHK
jgi:hypothetical protein